MKWTSLNDLREAFLSFFESRGHLRLPSFSLVPQGDKSLLLINSGMAPMKKYFTGEVTPPSTRVATCQKCIRTPDLDRVGHTARHGTFFEMLGNFSFGDYFKEEAIPFAWEFLTDCLSIPGELLWPSIYENDEEAYKIWTEKIGVDPKKVVRLGKADNFWEHGEGPCGPCSEIYFDRGEKYGCGSPDCRPGCDCDRYMEIWNNVFSQFNNDGKGNYTELAQKNIDSGMGLERLACVLQGVDNLFEVDSVRKILDSVCAVAKKTYGADKEDDISIRVVTDHVRSATFMIADGVIPSNEGRGYVLRRILRRAARHGKLLGIDRLFLCEMCEVAIGESRDAYPELATKHDYILAVVEKEEERFHATLDSGLRMLSERMEKAEGRSLSGEDCFKLYDTYGFPFDLTREIAEERGFTTDEEAFRTLMNEQRARARAARNTAGGWSESSKTALSGLPKTEFLGYTENECEATLLAILVDGESVSAVSEGEATLIFDRTVFYGEGGGQVGDTGLITKDGLSLAVTDTKKTDGVYLHEVSEISSLIEVGSRVTLSIDTARRAAIRRNHSSAHLLQAALRSVLGTHVEQAGSYVDEKEMRFDFTHFSALTKEEIASVEALVNEYILAAEEATTVETDPESAKRMGAMALFNEKYGDRVRVVTIGSHSVELCGGTHVHNSGAIGLFRIVSESSVAAGVRRITAITGANVLSYLDKREETMTAVAKELKANNLSDLLHRAEAVGAELKETRRRLESAEAKLSEAKLSSLLLEARTVGSVRLLTAKLDMSADAARTLCDGIKEKYADMVAVFAAVCGDKLNFVACCGKDAVKAGAHAGRILSSISAICGGKGGGRPDSAMSGGRDLSKIDEALAAVEGLL